MEDISATDIDSKIELRISRGAIVLNNNGQPPASIRISSRINNNAVNPGTQLISRLYDIEPSGTTFDPGATLIYKYSNSEIPDGISPENLFLAQWDFNQAQWIELGGAVDTIGRTVSVPIQHLSTYAVLAYNGPADFQFSAFTSDVREIYPGESLTFSVLVTNSGDSEGSCDVVLKVDGADTETITVTLGSEESQTVTFNVTPSTGGEHIASIGSLSVPFNVRQELAPSNFVTSSLSIYPSEINLGDSINISILVTNTGDLPGTYHAVLRVANTEEASVDVDLNGGGSKNVSFSITPESIGNYTVILGGLQAAFVVRTPAPVEPASTVLNINDFQITPTHNPDTDKLVLTKIDYQLEGTQEQLAGIGLMLKVSLDDVFLEEIPILSLNGDLNGNTGSYSYTPSAGWKAGTYSFQAVLYRGDVFLLSSEQKEFIATPEAVAAVFSWNIMAIIIASAMVVAAIIVVLTVLRRRDMLHN